MSSKRQPRHVPTNYFEVAAKLPSYDAARLIADGLLARPFTIWQGALRAIADKPSLLNKREVQIALNRRAETHIDSEFVSVVLLALRRNTRQRGVDQNLFGLELAARYLNHENSRVRRDAAQTMARLSGKRLGNNPAVWKKWWDEQSR
jgi:hypothetical protein